MRLTLSRQLLLLTLFTALALSLVMVLTFISLRTLKQDFGRFEAGQRSVSLLLDIKATALSVARADPVLAETATQLRNTDQAVRQALAQVRPLLEPAQAQLLETLVQTHWDEYFKQFQSAVTIAESSPQDALSIPEQIYTLQLAPMMTGLDGLVAREKRKAVSLHARIDSVIGEVMRGVLLPLLVAALVVIGVQSGLASRLKRRLRQMEAEARILQTGDLTRRLPQSNDELGLVATAFNGFVTELSRLLAEVQGEVAATHAGAGLLASRAVEVSRHTVSQGEDVAQIGAAVEELSVSVDSVAAFARDAAEAALEANRLTRSAEDRTADSLTDMRELQVSVRNAETTLATLDGSIGRVTAVSGLIKEIASQTNLLALNAAIEAARAGDSGRGFAVVADEVRKLSERTAGATSEIGLILGGLATNMQDARATMQDAGLRAEAEVSQAEAIASLMREAEAAVNKVQAMMGNIAEATVEQAHSSTAIAQELAEINQLTQATALAMEATQAEVAGLRAGAARLATASARFRLA